MNRKGILNICSHKTDCNISQYCVFNVPQSPSSSFQAKLQNACTGAYAYAHIKQKYCLHSYSCDYSDEK